MFIETEIARMNFRATHSYNVDDFVQMENTGTQEYRITATRKPLFSRVNATLEAAMSVGQSVCLSVTFLKYRVYSRFKGY